MSVSLTTTTPFYDAKSSSEKNILSSTLYEGQELEEEEINCVPVKATVAACPLIGGRAQESRILTVWSEYEQ